MDDIDDVLKAQIPLLTEELSESSTIDEVHYDIVSRITLEDLVDFDKVFVV